MHILRDENGNLIPHGAGHEHTHEHSHEHTHADGTTHNHDHSHADGAEHTHDHSHGHSHEHTHADGTTHTHSHDHHGDHQHSHECKQHCDSCGSGDCKNETVALLTYMLQHNEHHAMELDQMADNLVKLGMTAAAKSIKDGVSDFQKGNMRLALALNLVKEELGMK